LQGVRPGERVPSRGWLGFIVNLTVSRNSKQSCWLVLLCNATPSCFGIKTGGKRLNLTCVAVLWSMARRCRRACSPRTSSPSTTCTEWTPPRCTFRPPPGPNTWVRVRVGLAWVRSEQAGMRLPIDTRNPPSGVAEYFLSEQTSADPPALQVEPLKRLQTGAKETPQRERDKEGVGLVGSHARWKGPRPQPTPDANHVAPFQLNTHAAY
jgi:hypothetical protein